MGAVADDPGHEVEELRVVPVGSHGQELADPVVTPRPGLLGVDAVGRERARRVAVGEARLNERTVGSLGSEDDARDGLGDVEAQSRDEFGEQRPRRHHVASADVVDECTVAADRHTVRARDGREVIEPPGRARGDQDDVDPPLLGSRQGRHGAGGRHTVAAQQCAVEVGGDEAWRLGAERLPEPG